MDVDLNKQLEMITDVPEEELKSLEPTPFDFSKLLLAFEYYAKEHNLDITRGRGHVTFADAATEIAYCGFKEVILQHRKALVSLFSRQEVKPPFVVGRYIGDGTIQFAKRPRRHAAIEKAREQATDLSSKNNGQQFGVFGSLFRVGDIQTQPKDTWSGKDFRQKKKDDTNS